MQKGDLAVCYASGWQNIFAVVKVTGDPENDPARDRWRWRFVIHPLLVVGSLAKAPPVELPAGDDDALALRFHAVHAQGQYDAIHQILIDNKVNAGRPGFHVVAPLRLAASGRYVLVDRGWIAQGASRSELPTVPPPPGRVTVQGRVNRPPQRYLELGRGHAPGPLWENLDIERMAAATGLDLLPVVLEQTDPVIPPDTLVRDWPTPELGGAQNTSYMLQWYAFATIAVALWLTLNWRIRRGKG